MILQKIKQTFSDASGKSPFFDKLYLRTKYRMAMFLGAVWSEEHYARWFYHLYTGKKLNLQNPRYFDEKLWWLKLNNRDPLLTKCSDKHAVRDYVKACGYEDILILTNNCDNTVLLEVGDVIDTYVYRFGIKMHRYSYSAAVGLFKAIISVILVWLANAASKRFTDNSLW